MNSIFQLLLNSMKKTSHSAASVIAAFYIRQLKRLEAERQKMRLQLRRRRRPSSVSMNGGEGGAVIARTSLFVDRAPLTSERAKRITGLRPSVRPELDSGEIRNNRTRRGEAPSRSAPSSVTGVAFESGNCIVKAPFDILSMGPRMKTDLHRL